MPNNFERTKLWARHDSETNKHKYSHTDRVNPTYGSPFYGRQREKGNYSHNWLISPQIEVDLYFTIINGCCIRYESNILIFSKDNKQKPFFVHLDGTYWKEDCTDSGDTIENERQRIT